MPRLAITSQLNLLKSPILCTLLYRALFRQDFSFFLSFCCYRPSFAWVPVPRDPTSLKALQAGRKGFLWSHYTRRELGLTEQVQDKEHGNGRRVGKGLQVWFLQRQGRRAEIEPSQNNEGPVCGLLPSRRGKKQPPGSARSPQPQMSPGKGCLPPPSSGWPPQRRSVGLSFFPFQCVSAGSLCLPPSLREIKINCIVRRRCN